MEIHVIEIITCRFRYSNDIGMLAQVEMDWDWVSQTIVM